MRWVNDLATPSACPTCGRPTAPAARPFCSPRCADVDLQRWLSGVYAIPVEEDDEDVGSWPDDPGQARRPPL